MFSLTVALLGTALAATPCENLKSLSLPKTTITSSELIAMGAPLPGQRGGQAPAAAPQGAAPAAPQANAPRGGAQGGRGGGQAATAPFAFCRIVAVLKPTEDSEINTEIWLPARENWNGKFQAVGNGGWAGSIQGLGAAMPAALRLGYATSGSDTGHTGASGAFALGHPEKVIDFGYRAVHEMTVQSKALIKAFYDESPRLSYFNGCSTGGRQALMAAQRYPEDFDAILAGAPANNQVYLHAADMTRMTDIYKDPAGFIPQAKQTVLAQAVMNACDALDGVKDNLITNPQLCKFDPADLQCKAGDAADCLTAPQVATAKRIYTTARTSKGEVVFPGYPFGGESAYNIVRGGTAPGALQLDTFRYLGHQNPNWDWKTFNLDADTALANKNAGFINAIEPDLSKFKAHGGKLLLYHGWADPAIQAGNTVNYHSSVLAKMGRNQDNWLRLFMVPGMGHCGGGAGPNTVDWMSALETWREKGTAPDQIIGSNAAAGMTRPICPYPQVATYKGSGDSNVAANFVCKAP